MTDEGGSSAVEAERAAASRRSILLKTVGASLGSAVGLGHAASLLGEAFAALGQNRADRAVLAEYSAIQMDEERRTLATAIADEVSGAVAAILSQMPDGRVDQLVCCVNPDHAGEMHRASNGTSLASFAEGPAVPPEWLGSAVVEAFASLVKRHEAELLVLEAGDLLKSQCPSASYVRPWDLPSPEVPPTVYWHQTLQEARLHGPRMVAALLFSMIRRTLPSAERSTLQRLLERLPRTRGR